MPEPTKSVRKKPAIKKRRFPQAYGRYILEKSLSRGGMGEVILAVARSVNQYCIVKTIRGDLNKEKEFIGRFADEAKIMLRMDHPNIVRVFDAGKVNDDYYMAMEYVHGRDLGDVLDRGIERGEVMPAPIGLYITEQLLLGLDCVHSLRDENGRPMGLVHRDISPQNTQIGFNGDIKLIDFGLARADLLPGHTQGALAIGKYGYMSPEQARHQPLDGRADLYSAGAMLFEVFTGDRLVDEQDQKTLWERVLNPNHRSPRTVLPSLAPEIERLIMTAVQTRPEGRFPSAREMLKYTRAIPGRRATREELVGYLRYLYPRVEFSPPTPPSFGPLAKGTNESTTIATSGEAVLSIFGRGELAIAWAGEAAATEDTPRSHVEYEPTTEDTDQLPEQPAGDSTSRRSWDEAGAAEHEPDHRDDQARTVMMAAPPLSLDDMPTEMAAAPKLPELRARPQYETPASEPAPLETTRKTPPHGRRSSRLLLMLLLGVVALGGLAAILYTAFAD